MSYDSQTKNFQKCTACACHLTIFLGAGWPEVDSSQCQEGLNYSSQFILPSC